MVTFYDDEVERINRVQVALLLGIEPHRVDRMPPQDVGDVLAIAQANDELRSWQQSRAMKQSRAKTK